jgi:radical SAM protein (TIGR01212 family)
MKTCNFCDVWGSAAYPDLQKLDLRTQIEASRKRVQGRTNAAKFLIYFQAYTTTFSRVKEMREQFEIALSYPDVVGLVVGTRPDCISDALFDLWNEYCEKTFVAVEYGVQSFDEEQLIWMRRGHTAKRSIDAIHRTAQNTKVNLGIHLIFGCPNETEDDLIKAAKICNELPINNVKLHNLHVLKNTPLADDFAKGEFMPLSRSDYAERVSIFLQHLRPEIYVHRLAALSSQHDELIAPAWTNKKMETYQAMIDHMKVDNKIQGARF